MTDSERDICPLHSGIEERLNAVCHKLDEREKQMNIQFKAFDERIETAKIVMDHRLAILNELREDVIKDRNQFVKIDSYNAKSDSRELLFADLFRRITIIETRTVVWTSALAFFVIIVQIAIHFLRF